LKKNFHYSEKNFSTKRKKIIKPMKNKFERLQTAKIAHFIEKRHLARAKIKIDYSPPYLLFEGRVFHFDINFHEQSAKCVRRPQGLKAIIINNYYF